MRMNDHFLEPGRQLPWSLLLPAARGLPGLADGGASRSTKSTSSHPGSSQGQGGTGVPRRRTVGVQDGTGTGTVGPAASLATC